MKNIRNLVSRGSNALQLVPVTDPKPNVTFNPASNTNGHNYIQDALGQPTSNEGLDHLARAYQEKFNTNVEASGLPKLVDELRQALANKPTIEATYRSRLQTAQDEFRDTVQPVIQDKVNAKERARLDEEESAREREKNRLELENLKFQLTGDPRINVPNANWSKVLSIIFLIYAAANVLDTAMTYKMVGDWSDPTTGMAVTWTVNTLLFLFASLWGFGAVMMASAEVTKKKNDAFNRANVDSSLIRFKGMEIWQPSSIIKQAFETSQKLYWAVAAAWFAFRVIAVYKSPTGGNALGLGIAVLLILVGYGVKMLVTLFAPPYGTEHFRLNQLIRETRHQQPAKKQEKDAGAPKEITAAIEKLRRDGDAAWVETVEEQVKPMRQVVVNIKHLSDQVDTYRKALPGEYVTDALTVIQGIEDRLRKEQEGPNASPVELDADEDDILSHLAISAEDPFITAIRTGSITAESICPDKIALQPNSMIEQLERGVNPTVITNPGPAPISAVVNPTTVVKVNLKKK